jgi:hypothetical protein
MVKTTMTRLIRTSLGAAVVDDPQAFFALGGMRTIERSVADEAAAEAVRNARAEWLSILEAWYAAYPDSRMQLAVEIGILRKRLGIRQSPVERRARTAERVRRHRAAKSMAASE